MSILDLFSLKGRNALVTGASAGIGRAVAVALGSAGATVAITARRVSELKKTKALVEKEGGKAIIVAADLDSDAEIARLAKEAGRLTGGLDILVNSAAAPRGPTWGPTNDMKLEDVDKAMRLNFRVPFELTRLVAADMIAGKRKGSIIHLTSTSAHNATPNMAVYSASKAALRLWAEATAGEWGPQGIRVNCLSSGAVSTELTRAAFPDEKAEFLARGGEQLALRRLAKPEDIAPVVVFLASDASRHITATAIKVDGGKLAAGGPTKKPTT